MDHRQVLDMALRGLKPERASFLARVADRLQRDPALEDRRHLLYPVLAAAAAGIEPVLEPERCADLCAAFVMHHTEGIAATLYDPAYLTDPAAAMAPWAIRLQADLAEAILAKLAAGELMVAEPTVWRFSSDGPAPASFPYEED